MYGKCGFKRLCTFTYKLCKTLFAHYTFCTVLLLFLAFLNKQRPRHYHHRDPQPHPFYIKKRICELNYVFHGCVCAAQIVFSLSKDVEDINVLPSVLVHTSNHMFTDYVLQPAAKKKHKKNHCSPHRFENYMKYIWSISYSASLL